MIIKNNKSWEELLDDAADKYINGKQKILKTATKEELHFLLIDMAK